MPLPVCFAVSAIRAGAVVALPPLTGPVVSSMSPLRLASRPATESPLLSSEIVPDRAAPAAAGASVRILSSRMSCTRASRANLAVLSCRLTSPLLARWPSPREKSSCSIRMLFGVERSVIETALSGSPATSTDLASRPMWLSPICARVSREKDDGASVSAPGACFSRAARSSRSEVSSASSQGLRPSTIDAVPVMFCNTESTTRSLIRKPVIRWSASTSAASPANLSLSPAGVAPPASTPGACARYRSALPVMAANTCSMPLARLVKLMLPEARPPKIIEDSWNSFATSKSASSVRRETSEG